MFYMIKNKTAKGRIRAKRKDTKIGTIEKIYGKDFGVRSDMKLHTFLKKTGHTSLSKFLKSD